MIKAGVIGFPVQHSLSPKIFKKLSQILSKTIDYQKIEVQDDHLENFISKLKSESDWVGANLTIPHKVKVLTLLTKISDEARAVGAVNVIYKRGDKLEGHNTDVLGFIKSLDQSLPLSKIKSSTIFGTGGAARAVVFGLLKMTDSEIYIVGRDPGLNQFLNTFQSRRVHSEYSDHSDVYINATPVGMEGFLGGPAPWEALEVTSKKFIAMDLIYAPLETAFMQWAKNQGAEGVYNGLGMLVEQALDTWEIWFEKIPNRKSVADEIILDLEESL